MVKDREKQNEQKDQTKQILVVDDDVLILDLLKNSLEKAGYVVLTADNGIDAEKIFRENTVDLIIMDIIMPDQEGLETIIDLFREDPDLKIIAISSGGAGGRPKYHLECAEKLGVQITITKPFYPMEVIDAVKKLLRD